MGALRPSAVLSFRQSSASLLKLFALPLTRPLAQNGAAPPPAFLLHAKRTPAADVELKNDDGTKKDLPYVTRATVWAADNWQKLGQANEGTWKRKAYVTGDSFMDRIEFEEWALKAIDPALSPKPWTALKNGAEGVKHGKDAEKVELLYPKSLLSSEEMVESLRKQLDHREPHHRAAMIKCLVGAPLTFPFAIVPIVPNFPLFYVLWRAWSHFRAWKASQYLKSLLSASQIDIVASEQLDSIYSAQKNSTAPDQLLLTLEKVPKIVKAFGLSEEEAAELKRAVVQSEQRVKQVSGDSAKAAKEAVEGQNELKNKD